MTITEQILATEYSSEFDEVRKGRMVVSFYKYGPLKVNAGERLVDEIANVKERLRMYAATGNTELLADAANFLMIEFMHPQHPDAHFSTLDDGKTHLIGTSVNQMQRGEF
jgi:hypothetical protein